MRNDDACKVVGIGTVNVKMYEGIILTFGNVQHVLSLKKNLISLGTLDTNGYAYSSNVGKLKICMGSMVIMQGEIFQTTCTNSWEILFLVELLYPHRRTRRMTRLLYGIFFLAI